MKHFIDHFNDEAAYLLLNKETGAVEGRILAYWTKSGMCRANVNLYNPPEAMDARLPIEHYTGAMLREIEPDGHKMRNATGSAGGYGYDKLSSAISDALQSMRLLTMFNDNDAFTFSRSASPKEEQALIDRITASGTIPVYGGTGNHEKAFGLYWRVVRVI